MVRLSFLTPRGGVVSATVFVIGYMDDSDQFNIVFMERYRMREEPDEILKAIAQRCDQFNVRLIAADGAGNGSVYNSLLLMAGESDLEDCLATVRRHLAPAGRLVVQCFNPDLRLLASAPDAVRPFADYEDPVAGGRVLATWTHDYDRAPQVNHVHVKFRRADGTVSVETIEMRVLFPRELDARLERAGFSIERKLGDLDGSPFTSGSEHQILVLGHA